MTDTAILRYSLKIDSIQTIPIPKSHTILSCAPGRHQTDYYSVDVWAKASPGVWHTDVDVAFYILGTGHPWPTDTRGYELDLAFIGTCVMDDNLVWHIFTGPVPE